MKQLACFVIGVSALVHLPAANAALLDHGRTTVDTSTNLEWLDLSETSGYSFAEASAEFGAGGRFAGYRYATSTEVQAVFQQFHIPLVAPTSFSGLGAAVIGKGLKAFDTLFNVPAASGFNALVGDSIMGMPGLHPLFFGYASVPSVRSATASIFTMFPRNSHRYVNVGGSYVVYDDETVIALGEQGNPFGFQNASFLVRQVQATAVPEPQTPVLMAAGLALLGLAWRRRQVKQAQSFSSARPLR